MKADRLMDVRREALYAMLDAPATERQGWLESSLLDRHRSIREAAGHYLVRDVGEFDVRGHYLNALRITQAGELAAAIAGLGETGQKCDAELLLPFMQHPR